MYRTYSGFEWLLIDLASRFKNGKEKFTYEKRIAWSKDLLPEFQVDTTDELINNLSGFIQLAGEQPHFVGCALAIWDAIQGNESNWQVSQDSASSGPQLMSCMTKCVIGMTNTGVLGELVPDLYTSVNDSMGDKGVAVTRKILKEGMIPYVYKGTVDAKRVFEDNYPHFVEAYAETVPGAQRASELLVKAWNSKGTEHVIVAPDGFVGRIPVLVKVKQPLPYLHHRYKYTYERVGIKQAGKAEGTKALAANGVQLYDAYILRELNRRCDYIRDDVVAALEALHEPIAEDDMNDKGTHLRYLEQLSRKFKQVSAVALGYIDKGTAALIGDEYRLKLIDIFESMLFIEPFTIKNVHDDFACLPNHVGDMKDVYNVLLRETYLGRWLFAILKDLTGKSYKVPEVNMEVADAILTAPYSVS